MKALIQLLRKTKGLFLLLNLHYPLGVFSGPSATLSYLVKFSQWRKKHGKAPFNDFYSYTFNYDKRLELYQYVIDSEKLNDQPIDYWEFGVAGGNSFEWWSKNHTHPKSKLVGFDTFSGLPEDWNVFKKGDMSAQGKYPNVNDNRCFFEEGLFQDTLPGFLKTYKGGRKKVIHMDADLYTATLYALTSIAPFLNKGDIILFDEFGVPMHEFKAWDDFTRSYYIDYEVVGAVNNYLQIAVKVK